jgi:hypothetical protein
MEKKCTKCEKVKSLDEFTNSKTIKHGKKSRCKDCIKEYRKEYRKKNKDKIKEKQRLYDKKRKEDKKKYNIKNKDKISQQRKIYKEKNKERIALWNKEYRNKNLKKRRKYVKKYYEDNKEKRRKYAKKYYEDNKEKILKNNKIWYYNNVKKNRERSNTYSKERRKIDPIFKLKCCISSNICKALKAQGYTKNTKTFNILKCDYDFFMQWLNGLASNGHTYGIGELHLDHVIPISLAETEDEAILLSHYSNYQLLSADENIVKGNRYVNPLNLARVLEHHPNPDKIREIHARL